MLRLGRVNGGKGSCGRTEVFVCTRSVWASSERIQEAHDYDAFFFVCLLCGERGLDGGSVLVV
jgi:hypothetical protein